MCKQCLLHAVSGMFFQWVMCTAVWLTGLVVAAVRDFPKFYPLAMAGGLMWCTGMMYAVYGYRKIIVKHMSESVQFLLE